MKNSDMPVLDKLNWHNIVRQMVPELDSLTKANPDGVTFKVKRQGVFTIEPFNIRQADVTEGAVYENDQGWWWIKFQRKPVPESESED